MSLSECADLHGRLGNAVAAKFLVDLIKVNTGVCTYTPHIVLYALLIYKYIWTHKLCRYIHISLLSVLAPVLIHGSKNWLL